MNVWGTVCGDFLWGLADAQVACRQLGLPSTGATSLTVNGGSDAIQVSSVRCGGTESSLFDCYIELYEMHCFSSSYAGVSCQDSKSCHTRRYFQQ